MKKIVAPILASAVLAFALQLPQPIPPFGGDGNPQHDGQPAFCQNDDSGGHLHNCSCKPSSMADPACQRQKSEDDDPDAEQQEAPRCSVYCRPKACRCAAHCGQTR